MMTLDQWKTELMQNPTYGFGSLGTTGFSTASGTIYNGDITGVTLATNDGLSSSGNYKAGSGYTLTPSAASGPETGNYSISYSANSGTLNVAQAALTVSGITASQLRCSVARSLRM